MTRLDRKSDSQANAEAVARRDSAYLSEHYASRERRSRPRGLIALLHWFEVEWQEQAPDELHRFDLWREYIAAQDAWRRQGGGSRLGTLAWTEGMRRLLEAPRSQDPDGWYSYPLQAALVVIERGDGYMAAFLRAIALAGFTVPIAQLPESVAMVYANEALERLWRAYREEAPARLLYARATIPPTDELSRPDVGGAGVLPLPADDGAASLAVPAGAL